MTNTVNTYLQTIHSKARASGGREGHLFHPLCLCLPAHVPPAIAPHRLCTAELFISKPYVINS